MKKSLLLVIAACLLTACSGGGSKGGPENIFGDFPDKFDEVAEELREESEKMKEQFENKNNKEDIAEAFALLGMLGRKLTEGTEESREKLVGTKLPFEVEDSLPYTVSDVTVTKVYMEKLADVVMTAKFTIKFKEDFDFVESVFGPAIYHTYPIVTGDAGTMYALDCKASIAQFPREEKERTDSFVPDYCYHFHAGDTLSMSLAIKPDDTVLMRKCQSLRFVGHNGFITEFKAASSNRQALLKPTENKEE